MKSQKFSAEAIANSAKNAWTQLLTETLKDKADKVPKGFQTREQIQKEMGLQIAQTGRIVRQLYEAGKVERKILRVMVGGCLRPIPFYRRK